MKSKKLDDLVCWLKDKKPEDIVRLVNIWLKFHWENYLCSNFIKVEPENNEEGVIVLSPIGNAKINYYIGIMDANRGSKIFALHRVVADGRFAITIPFYSCFFFITDKEVDGMERRGLLGLKAKESRLGLEWTDGIRHKRDAPEIKDLDLYKCPRQC